MIRSVHLVGVQPTTDLGALDRLGASLAKLLHVSCHVRTEILDSAFAVDHFRKQAYSTAILARLAQWPAEDGVTLLGVTEADLFVPVLTFVFGEAQMPGRAALVSLHRLREEFYGLPPDDVRLEERLVKEAMHEIGHTQGLRHCDDWRCVMTSSHAVEKLDVKGTDFCPQCAKIVSGKIPARRFGGIM